MCTWPRLLRRTTRRTVRPADRRTGPWPERRNRRTMSSRRPDQRCRRHLPTRRGRSRTHYTHRRSNTAESRSRNRVRPAVETSVTNEPHIRCSSQTSLVVMTGSGPTRSRSHATLGATKYGSSCSPVIWVSRSSQPSARNRSHNDALRRSCHPMALPTGPSSSPRRRSSRPGGEPDGVGGVSAADRDCLPGSSKHAVPQPIGIDLDAAVDRGRWPAGRLGLGLGQHDSVVVDDSLGCRRPLIDGKHPHARQS